MNFKNLKLCVFGRGGGGGRMIKVGSINFREGDLDEISKRKQNLESAFHPMIHSSHLFSDHHEILSNSLTFPDFG